VLKKIMLSLLTITGLLACTAASPEQKATIPSSPEPGESTPQDLDPRGDHLPQGDLAKLRQDTLPYRDDINAACAAGFRLGINGNVKGCISNPTLGAMGYHYSLQARFDDPKIDENEPEVLVYRVAADGSLKLGAVEWVVPKEAWEAAHGAGADPPMVYGRRLSVINPVLNWYVAHAWVWEGNPSGVMSDWNPNESCPLDPRMVPTCEQP
jgi:hypothetical protein